MGIVFCSVEKSLGVPTVRIISRDPPTHRRTTDPPWCVTKDFQPKFGILSHPRPPYEVRIL